MQRKRAKATAAVLASLAAAQIRLLRRTEVCGFLARHSQLTDSLRLVGAEARQRLGADVELSLELYKDPEIDDQYLTLYVRQRTYDLSIMDRNDAVREQLAPLLDTIAGRFLITTDFCPPRRSLANGAQRVRRPRRVSQTAHANGRRTKPRAAPSHCD